MGNKTITLVDGYREIEVELICAFEESSLNSRYIIYTKNEKDRDGNTIIYAGKILSKNNSQFLENISEGKEWNRLKEIMKAMSKHSLEGETYV